MSILMGVSRLVKIVAMLALVLYGLASLHCTLEAVPGFEFLKTCCFLEPASTGSQDCENDGCGSVEGGNYRPEERTDFAPQPPLVLALFSWVIEAPLPEPQTAVSVASESPPEISKVWQFSSRTALPPRAPTVAS